MLHDSDQKGLNDFQTHPAINKNKKSFTFASNLFANRAHLALLQVKFKLKCAAKWLTSTLQAFIIRFDEWISRYEIRGIFYWKQVKQLHKRARDQVLISVVGKNTAVVGGLSFGGIYIFWKA